MSTYRMMQKLNFVHYQKMYILNNIIVFKLGHLARKCNSYANFKE
jgi:hypothetical protein